MIAIIDYGLGNLRSIQNMLHRAGIASTVSGDPAVIRSASRLILPGVGHFSYGMEQLRQRGLVEVLDEEVLEKAKPVLGICLGGQLIGRHSQEGDVAGLGWAPMDTVAFDRSRLSHGEKVPHMGWADTRHTASPLFEGLGEDARFYYVHSYHMVCDDPGMVIATAEHGYEFTCAVAHRNVIGVQFHPEKSHVFGRRLLVNFANMVFAA